METILKKMLFPLIKRKIIKEGSKWAEETINYGISDWKNYQANRFDKLKRNPWTSKAFPKLKEIEYEDLPNFDKTSKFPSYPPDFPAYRTILTTGTVERKLIKFTRDDLFFIAKSVTAEFQKATNSIGRVLSGRFLALVGGEAYISGNLIEMAKLFTERVEDFDPLAFKTYYDKIVKMAPFRGLVGIQAYILALLEQLEENIFVDGLWVIVGGDVLTSVIQNFIYDKLSALGVSNIYIMDVYGCSEGAVMATSMEFLRNDVSLVIWPDINIMMIEKENGRLVNLLDAKKGDRGSLYLTPMLDFMIPNYKLGDIIEVIGFSDKFKVPKIRVLGRETYKVSLKHPELGVIEGYSGGLLRIFGIPFNTYAFEELIGKLTKNFLLIIEKEGNKALFKLYLDKLIQKEVLEKQLENTLELHPIYHGIVTGLINIEIYKTEVKHKDLIDLNWKGGGQLKIPKIIVKKDVIKRPGQ